MAQIVTITNPLTGQPAQVDQLEHTAQQIDDAIARALPGGAIDIALQNKLGGIESTDYPGCYYRMVSGVVEWFNPPMQLGGVDGDGNIINEYRTTERYLGKPVYVIAINFGALPNKTTGDVEHHIANIENVISVGGTKSDGGTIPYHTDYTSIDVCANKTHILIKTAENQSAATAVTWIAYTKTTD